MAISTQTQNLNLIPGKSAPVVVHLSQGNVGDTVQFYLYNGDNPYYPNGVSIAVHGVRADGTAFGPYPVTITGGSNLVSFSIVSAMTSVYGAAIGELVVTDANEHQVGSANFGMLIEETPYSSSVTYEDDLSIYQRILAYVQSFPASVTAQIDAERNARIAADAALKKRKVIVIGDSYCDAGRGGLNYGWYTSFINAAGLSNGTDAFLYAKGGAGLVGAGQGKTFGNLLDEAIAAHTADKNDITDIIMAGGANDCSSSQSDINTAKDAFYNKVRANFPNAILHVAMISGFVGAANRKLLMDKVRYTYYYGMVGSFRRTVCNAHLPMMRMCNYIQDGVHPNGNGCTEIGRLIANHFMNDGGETSVFTNSLVKFTPANLSTTTGISSGPAPFRIKLTNHFYALKIVHGSGINFSQAKSATHNTGITFPVGRVASGADNNMLVANATSLTDNEPVFDIPCTFMAYTGGVMPNNLTWVPLVGSIIGVADSSNNVEWYFRAETVSYTCSFSQGRFTDFCATVS